MSLSVWGYLSGQYSIPRIGVVRIALCLELPPLPGYGYIECMGQHTHVNLSQVLLVLAYALTLQEYH